MKLKVGEVYDVIIVGGGYNGLSLAGMLANAGLHICLIERGQIKQCKERGAMPIDIGERRVDDAKNGNWYNISKASNEPSRLLAISRSSCDIYKKYGLLDKLFSTPKAEYQKSPIKHIRVVDGGSHAFIDFDPKEIGYRDFGYMVEEHDLGAALYKDLQSYPNLKLIEGQEYNNFEVNDYGISAKVGKRMLRAKLIVAADGKASAIRAITGIDYVKHAYRQCAVICDVGHELNQGGVAVEKFMPAGPFAILPKAGGYSSSVVWTLPEGQAEVLKGLDEVAIMDLLEERFEGFLGKLRLQSKLRFFRLELVYARQYYDKRVALLGDALHAIHPLAGQGLNLSLRDADTLADLIKKHAGLGLDIGSEVMLREYQSLREADNLLMIEGTEKLNYLFSNGIIPLRFIRRLGLQLVNRMPTLKRIFMQYASTGNLRGKIT